MPRSSLQAHALWGGYPGDAVIRGIDLTITAGDAPVGVIGPSGAGKTTLAQLLRGSMKPTSGSVMYKGRPVGRLRGDSKRDFVAAVRFQSQDSMTVTNPRLTVADSLKSALKEARKAGRTHATSHAALLDAVALPEGFVSRAVSTLSGGERQRVALATALATRPEMLVLDEPFTAVDQPSRREAARRLGGLLERLGTAAVIITHDLELVERLCPSAHFLTDGQFVASGPLGEILARGEHPAVREMAAAAPLATQRFR